MDVELSTSCTQLFTVLKVATTISYVGVVNYYTYVAVTICKLK